ncbi:MAG: hypothetical protein ACLFTF_00735, partial [Desulfonatronovibrio sp.]
NYSDGRDAFENLKNYFLFIIKSVSMIPWAKGLQRMHIYWTKSELTDAIPGTSMGVPALEKTRGLHLNLTHFLSNQWGKPIIAGYHK